MNQRTNASDPNDSFALVVAVLDSQPDSSRHVCVAPKLEYQVIFARSNPKPVEICNTIKLMFVSV